MTVQAGIHDHTQNKHTWQEIALNFVLVLFSALNSAYIMTQSMPTIDQFYGMLVNAVVATGMILGYNVTKAYQKKSAAKKAAKNQDEPHFLIDGVEA